MDRFGGRHSMRDNAADVTQVAVGIFAKK